MYSISLYLISLYRNSGVTGVQLPLGFKLFNRFPALQHERKMAEISITLLIFGHHFSLSFLFSLKVRESKPRRNTGSYCYGYLWSGKVYCVISVCCTCWSSKGIPISVGMSENKSNIVLQEVSLTTKIRGYVETCQLHQNMRRPGYKPNTRVKGGTTAFLGLTTIPTHLFMIQPYKFTYSILSQVMGRKSDSLHPLESTLS